MRWLCAKWDAVDVVATVRGLDRGRDSGNEMTPSRQSGLDEVAVCKMGCCRCGNDGDWTGAGTVEMK